MTSTNKFLALLFHLVCATFAEFAGPYELIPLEFGKCSPSDCEETKIFFTNYKIRKLNRTSYFYSGELNLTIPWSDDVKMMVDISTWGNGGWKPNFYNWEVGGLCSGLEKYTLKFKNDLFSFLHHPCPVPVGVYNITNLNLSQASERLKTLVYGKFKAMAKGYDQTGKCVMCWNFVCNCIPKKKKNT
ncbi:uncharacterized protein LOC106661790 [Cimex lectularius]|uniref:Uncharacterized protein n=1 Tax=Cimex lectularius TaxID=79782 RepID=A0A8I6REE2_CIMLE|nr:uncharacterized protein LOC106661790 [Cimex lectularius]